MIGFLVGLQLGLLFGLFWLDRRSEARWRTAMNAIRANLPDVERASKAGAVAIAAELDNRVSTLVAGENQNREILRALTGRVSSIEASNTLVPPAILALRSLLEQKFQEWEERQIPEEAQNVAASAMSRIRTVREQLVANEEASLKALQESLDKGARQPLIRVRAGD
jgi:hypothetical protein